MVAALTQLLLGRLDLEPPQLHADELRDVIGLALPAALAGSVLRETTPARTATCWECGGSDIRHVVYISPPGSVERIPLLPCPVCGPQRISPDQLRRWTIDLGSFCDALAAAAALTGTPTAIVPPHLWKLGHARLAGATREVFLARNVDATSHPAVQEALCRHPKAVLFLPTERAAQRWFAGMPTTTLALENVLSVGPDGLSFDRATLAALAGSPGADGQTKRRPPKRGTRLDKISRLEKELKAHLKAAKDHAHDTRQRTKEPVLLPRPTQAELAKRTDMSASDVSRCLNDPEAHMLRMLWRQAQDLDAIMGWKKGQREEDTAD